MKSVAKVYGAYHAFEITIPQVTPVRLDLCDEKEVIGSLDRIQPELVIHAAALSDPDACEADPDYAASLNVESTRVIAAWCDRHKARLIFISTDMVFDGKRGNYREEDRPKPLSVYAATKVEAEQIVRKSTTEALICRMALMYGRGLLKRYYSSEWLARELLNRKTGSEHQPAIGLYINQIRSMLAVTDAARLIAAVAPLPKTGLIHIGGPQAVTRYAFGLQLCRQLRVNPDMIAATHYRPVRGKATRPLNVSLNSARLRSWINIPILGIKEGLHEIYSTT